MLQNIVVGTSGCSSAFLLDSPAFAKNLPNPVTVDTSRSGTTEALTPILKLKESLEGLRASLQKKEDAEAIASILKAIPTTERSFKSIFDAYSDPVSYKQKFLDQNAFLVYYTKGFDGPGRPSIESDLPLKQTLQYGARNDAWVAWDGFLAELDFQRKNPSEADTGELTRFIDKAVFAVDSYLNASDVGD